MTATQTHALAELADRLGGIAVERIVLDPAPGTATEGDCLRLGKSRGAILELVDGVLVEKAMGFWEARLGSLLAARLVQYCEEHDIGIVLADGGYTRMNKGNVRVPDAAVYPWASFPDSTAPDEKVSSTCPMLVVEVLSRDNTRAEIAMKLKEFFASGTVLAWVIDPAKRTAKVHTSPTKFTTLDDTGTLDGADVVPGFRCTLADLFAAGERRSPRGKMP